MFRARDTLRSLSPPAGWGYSFKIFTKKSHVNQNGLPYKQHASFWHAARRYASPHGSQVTEEFVKASANALINSGLAKKGYTYVNV